MIIIITMPLVFLIVVMAIIGIFGKPKGGDDFAAAEEIQSAPIVSLEEPAAPSQSVVLPVPAAAAGDQPVISLPENSEVGAISLDGDRLAVRIDGEDGATIVIYDLRLDAVVKTIPVTAAAN